MSTSLFRHFYFRFACTISHWIWPWTAVENRGRRSELEMFAEHKLQPVDILREEAILSLPCDLEGDSNPRRVRSAALHLHMRSHTNWLFWAAHVHVCENIWSAPLQQREKAHGSLFHTLRHVSLSFLCHISIKTRLRFALDKLFQMGRMCIMSVVNWNNRDRGGD